MKIFVKIFGEGDFFHLAKVTLGVIIFRAKRKRERERESRL